MAKVDETMAAVVGRALMMPELRKQIIADPDTALANIDLPLEYRMVLIEGLKEVEEVGLASARLPKKFGTNAWGIGGSVL